LQASLFGKRRRLCGSRSIRAQRRLQRLAQHDQRRLEIGNAGRRHRAGGQRCFEKDSGLLEGGLDVVASKVLVEARLLRQHLRNRLLQFRRQAG
jgi:hypothetical protein